MVTLLYHFILQMIQMKARPRTESISQLEISSTPAAEDQCVQVRKINSSYLCPLCPYKSRFRSDVKRHFRTRHTQIRPFSCSFCPLRFALKQELDSHSRTHTGEKPFQCRCCAKRFKHRNSLKYHLQVRERCTGWRN